jgi:hypothetical protein
LYGQSLVIILPKLWLDISASVVLQFNFRGAGPKQLGSCPQIRWELLTVQQSRVLAWWSILQDKASAHV